MQSRRILITPRHRWWWWGVPAAALLGALFGWWVSSWQAAPVASTASAATGPTRQAATASAPTAAPPYSPAGMQLRESQLALWRGRLERAQEALDTYNSQTRYPHTSRPAAEQADQMYPNQPVVEDHPLREPKGAALAGVRLRTTQERIFVQGDESVRFTIAVVDDAGEPQPVRVLNAAAREVTRPTVASLYPVLPVTFADDGRNGDEQADDGEFSAQLRPATQGFAGLTGQIRLEVFMEVRGERGFTYFDIYVSTQPPALWSGHVRESIDDSGSLVYALGATVREPGRYVVTGRVDDAQGKPFALLTFNDEVGRGEAEFKLTLFGKLVRDAAPPMPLTLRDVVAFRLREEGHPDRVLMPRLNGTVLVGARHALASLSEAPWSSEERARYQAELTRDVRDAQREVDKLSAVAKP
jgi:hypothetical protein